MKYETVLVPNIGWVERGYDRKELKRPVALRYKYFWARVCYNLMLSPQITSWRANIGPPDENSLTANDDGRGGLEVFAERPDSAIEIRYRAHTAPFSSKAWTLSMPTFRHAALVRVKST